LFTDFFYKWNLHKKIIICENAFSTPSLWFIKMKKFKTKNTLCSIKGSVTALSIAISVAISTTMVAFAADPVVPAVVTPVATSPETVFNLRVSYYDTYENAVTNNRLDAIRANLKAFGTVLYEATNGKHKLGKVSVYFGGAFKDDTDILWVKSCWPNANVAGYKKPGSRIEHCDTFDTTPFLTNTMAGGVTLLHEWGHFGYGVYDEYKNDAVTCDVNNPGSPCKDDVPTDKTLMNSHWDSMTETNGVSTLTDLRPLNFSTKRNFSKVTAQGRVYNMSAWDTLLTDPALDKSQIGRTFYPNLKDAAPPLDSPDTFEIGTQDGTNPAVLDPTKITTALNKFNVEFINGSVVPVAPSQTFVLTAGTDVVPAKDNSVSYILIDTSKEVTADQLTDAKGAIEAIIEGAEEGETISVISYDNNSTEVVKPSRITDSNSKAAIMAEVAKMSISASDDPDLTAAFKVALKNLPLGTVNSIYILGSGKNTNVDTDLLKWIGQYSVIVNALTTVNDPVIVKPLDSVAKETHGVFRLVNTSSDYFAALENANQASSPEIDATIVANDSLSLKANTTKNVPFYVDSTLGSLNFNLGYTGGADDAKLPEITLINPKGVKRVVIPADECDVVQDAVGSSPQENFCNVELSDPKVGKWTLVIKPKEQTEVNFSLNGVAKNNDQAISSQIIFDDNTGVFTASVGDNIPMSGVRVTALVKDSKGKISTVVMNDNGKTGDLSSNDGIFTGKLINPTPGMYSINVSYDNSLGKASKTHKSGLYLPTTPGVSPDKVKSTPYKEAFMRNDISRVYFYGQ
jgi:5-hydroxyisourate hydrolase-like protein (transthyretin family)